MLGITGTQVSELEREGEASKTLGSRLQGEGAGWRQSAGADVRGGVCLFVFENETLGGRVKSNVVLSEPPFSYYFSSWGRCQDIFRRI